MVDSKKYRPSSLKKIVGYKDTKEIVKKLLCISDKGVL